MRPNILVFGGHDPTGGAGIQADIETIGILGARALTIPTALTIQNSHRVIGFEIVAPQLVQQQAEALFEEFPVAAIKIGMVGSTAVCEAIATLLEQKSTIPVVVDPVLAGGGGGKLSTDDLTQSIRKRLLSRATIATPNRSELQRLTADAADITSSAKQLLNSGCQHLLVTGTDDPQPGEDTTQVFHRLLSQNGESNTFKAPRLPYSYHGSGCTLASAIATRIAYRDPVAQAVETALDFTLQTLQQGEQPASGQHFPNRFINHE